MFEAGSSMCGFPATPLRDNVEAGLARFEAESRVWLCVRPEAARKATRFRDNVSAGLARLDAESNANGDLW